MSTSQCLLIIRQYRLDYLAYVFSVIILYSITFLPGVPEALIYIPLFLAWLPLTIEAIKSLSHKRIGNEFFLAIATIFALLGHQQQAIMIVLIIMLIAEFFESIIEAQTEKALEKLIALIPTDVICLLGDEEKTIPLSQVTPGMNLLVKTGGRIPADGIVVDGVAAVNEAALTGESAPQEKNVHSKVYAGTYIESGSLIILAEKVKEETLFGKITDLMREAEKKKANITIFTDKIAFVFTPTVLCFIALVWFLTKNTNVVVTLLVFGSPLELALITPLTMLAGSVAAYRQGILVKSALALEYLAQAKTIIFDKTGTLTLGEPTLVNIEVFDSSLTSQDVLKIAAVAEKYSEHVVAKAILRKAKEQGMKIENPQAYKSLAGHGIEITYKDKRYFLGNKHFIEASEHTHLTVPETRCRDEETHSSFYLSSESRVIGKICVADMIRSDAHEVIERLKRTGFDDVVLLSGDRQEITTNIADTLGIKKAFGNVFPDEKLNIIKKIQQSGRRVAMIGDGINDALALKQADIGIAMGAMGVELAIEAADLVLMTNELEKIVFLRKLAQKIMRVIKENLIFGFLLFHSLGIMLTLAGYVTPIEAAAFHSLSDFIILLNSSRLINFKG